MHCTVFLRVLLACLGVSAWAGDTNVQMLVPGFTVREVPVRLNNVNSLRFAPDGRLTALGYDGRIHLLRDTDGDGMEDRAEVFWDKPTLSVPVGMAWSTEGLVVSAKGKVALLRDTDGDWKADVEEILASGWPSTDVGSGGVDATSVTLDAEGNVYFGLMVADYANAYRLRKRKDLKPEEKTWLTARGQSSEGDPEEEVSLYDLNSPRGTIQKWNRRTRKLETVATGIRVPYTLAFNRAGDLFLTDQEGETWMPGGNPLDELNHIVAGRNYGFPPRHPKWLPDLVSEEPVVGFGPQHQSTCGFVFNEPHRPLNVRARDSGLPVSPGQALFGPPGWAGDAIVTGESRGKLWRVKLVKTERGYVGKEFTIARLGLLTTDVAISPKGDLYVSCHSGPPDWGTGPKGEGKLFKISYTDPAAPQPVLAWRENTREVRVAFDRAVNTGITNRIREHRLEVGEFVTAGDRFETLKPPYEVVQKQALTPREFVMLRSARLIEDGRVVAIETESSLQDGLGFGLSLAGVSASETNGFPATVDVEFDTRQSGTEFLWKGGKVEPGVTRMAAASAPKKTEARASPGGDWRRGKELFASETLQCAKCHRVGGEGGVTGPDLSNLLARDIASVLRDLREPSATIHPDYTGYIVSLKDGEEVTGFIQAQTADFIRLVDINGKEIEIRRSDVAEVRPTALSMMPEGLIDSLNPEQVKDLLTFLMTEPPKATKKAPEKKKATGPQRTRAEVESVLAAKGEESARVSARPLSLTLVASKQDHGPGEHDYPAWQTNWSKWLGRAEGVTISTAWEWPAKEQFQAADVLVYYFWNHNWSPARYAQIDSFLERGGGLVILHAACIADQEPENLAQRLGLAAQPVRTKYRHGPVDLKMVTPRHEITRGFPEQIHFVDETYWPLIGDTNAVEVLATAEEEGKPWPMIWTSQTGKGRIFGSILGHYSWTLDDPFFRILVLRGLAWSAGEPTGRFENLVVVKE